MSPIRDASQNYSDRNERALAANFKTRDDQRVPVREMPTTTLRRCSAIKSRSLGADRPVPAARDQTTTLEDYEQMASSPENGHF